MYSNIRRLLSQISYGINGEKKIYYFRVMKFLEKYYPVILAALSVAYSNYLWFSGKQLDGLYVGLWPVTILAFALVLRQRRNDSKKD